MSSDHPQEVDKLVTLREFLELYQKTIAVMGVFVALGLLWKNVQGNDSVPYLSYLCFLITIPLLIEVRKGYEYQKSSWNLVIFIDLFQGILLLSAYHLVVDYPDHLEKIILGVIGAVIFFGLGNLADKLATKIRTKDYNDVVAKVAELEKENLPIETRNSIVEVWNKYLQQQSNLLSALEVFLVILFLILAGFTVNLISGYVHATIDVTLDRNDEVVAPPPMK